MVRPESTDNYPGTLGNKPIAVNFHAGSHYVALRLLEGYLPNEKIKLVHYGSPAQRFEAMLSGEVAAAAVSADPGLPALRRSRDRIPPGARPPRP